ncbi:MAG: glucosaminidase domain-containing protein [Flavobacteriales bacterium]
MPHLRIFIAFLLLSLPAFSQADSDKNTAADYIASWHDEAVRQMVKYNIPASITLAQGLLESGNGNSRLATQGNNHFGIKCHSDWKGATIREDDETRQECFRKYKSAEESFEDHSIFLTKKRYEPLFQLKIDDYKGWAHGLKKCGYATNPKYPQLLIDIIERYDLTQYDKEGLKHIKNSTSPSSGNKKPKENTKKNQENHQEKITVQMPERKSHYQTVAR